MQGGDCAILNTVTQHCDITLGLCKCYAMHFLDAVHDRAYLASRTAGTVGFKNGFRE